MCVCVCVCVCVIMCLRLFLRDKKDRQIDKSSPSAPVTLSFALLFDVAQCHCVSIQI